MPVSTKETKKKYIYIYNGMNRNLKKLSNSLILVKIVIEILYIVVVVVV